MSGIWVRPGSTLQIFIVYRLHNRMGGELWIRGCTWLVPKMNTSALSCYESIFFLYINCSPELALGTGFALSGKDSKSHLLFSVDQRSVWLRHSPQKNSPPSLDICECRGSYLCIHVDTPVCFKDGRQDVFLGLLRWVFFRNPVHSYRRCWTLWGSDVMVWFHAHIRAGGGANLEEEVLDDVAFIRAGAIFFHTISSEIHTTPRTGISGHWGSL